jgi:hypothetical protein
MGYHKIRDEKIKLPFDAVAEALLDRVVVGLIQRAQPEN